MGDELCRIEATYRLHLRCVNCLKDSSMQLDIPDGVYEFDDLTECVEMNGLRYQCCRCEGVIGQIVGMVRGG